MILQPRQCSLHLETINGLIVIIVLLFVPFQHDIVHHHIILSLSPLSQLSLPPLCKASADNNKLLTYEGTVWRGDPCPPSLPPSLNTKHRTVTDCKLDIIMNILEQNVDIVIYNGLTVLSKHGSGIPKPARWKEN